MFEQTVTEAPNDALSASCTCGWVWGYQTADEALADEAGRQHDAAVHGCECGRDDCQLC
jgi:hypothetical protein